MSRKQTYEMLAAYIPVLMVLIVFSVVLWLAEPAATTRPIIEQPDRQVTVDIPLPTLKQKDEILRLLDEGAEGVVLDIETGEVTEASRKCS